MSNDLIRQEEPQRYIGLLEQRISELEKAGNELRRLLAEKHPDYEKRKPAQGGCYSCEALGEWDALVSPAERNGEERAMSYDVTFDEAERQAIVLALAKLSSTRPGWTDMLRRIANRLSSGNLFDEFRVFGPDSTTDPPIEDDQHLVLDHQFTITRGGETKLWRVDGESVSEDTFWIMHAESIDRALAARRPRQGPPPPERPLTPSRS